MTKKRTKHPADQLTMFEAPKPKPKPKQTRPVKWDGTWESLVIVEPRREQ